MNMSRRGILGLLGVGVGAAVVGRVPAKSAYIVDTSVEPHVISLVPTYPPAAGDTVTIGGHTFRFSSAVFYSDGDMPNEFHGFELLPLV